MLGCPPHRKPEQQSSVVLIRGGKGEEGGTGTQEAVVIQRLCFLIPL